MEVCKFKEEIKRPENYAWQSLRNEDFKNWRNESLIRKNRKQKPYRK